ncbi:MAG: hypothetical protein N2C14_21665 [Planctomycetales bacterium]
MWIVADMDNGLYDGFGTMQGYADHGTGTHPNLILRSVSIFFKEEDAENRAREVLEKSAHDKQQGASRWQGREPSWRTVAYIDFESDVMRRWLETSRENRVAAVQIWQDSNKLRALGFDDEQFRR